MGKGAMRRGKETKGEERRGEEEPEEKRRHGGKEVII